MSLGTGALGYSIILPTIGPELITTETSAPPTGKGIGSYVAVNDNQPVNYTQTIRLFILGTFIFLLIYVWIVLINILINVFFETTFPGTVTINEGLTNKDFISAISKQLIVCIIITILTFLVVYKII